MVGALTDANIAIDDIGVRRPTLDDVFLSLTGHTAELATDDEQPAAAAASGRKA